MSTVHLAAALRDNGGGRLVGSELEPQKVAQARTNLPETVDLLLLDGHKPLYVPILDLVAPRLRPGAFLVADNVDASPEYVSRARGKGGDYLSVPFAQDVEVSIKL